MMKVLLIKHLLFTVAGKTLEIKMTNKPYIYNGSKVITREKVTLLEPVTNAPNIKFGEDAQLVLTDANEMGVRFIDFTIPGPLDQEILGMSVKSTGFIAGKSTTVSKSVSLAILNNMKQSGGTFRLGTELDFLKSMTGTNPTRVELVFRNNNGWGLVQDIWEFTFIDDTDDIPFEVQSSPVIIGSLIENEPLTYIAMVWSGDSNIQIEVFYRRTENDGLNPEEEYPATGIIPPQDGSRTYLQVGEKASGPGADETIYWSDPVHIAQMESEPIVSIDRLPFFAEFKLQIKDISNDTFNPGDIVTSGTASAVIVGYIPETSTLFLGSITDGSIANNTSINSSGGGSATTNGTPEAWVITAGESIYFLPPTFTGTPTEISLIQEIRKNADDLNPKVVELVGVMPKHYGTMQYRVLWRYSGYGIDTYEEEILDWQNIGIPILDPLETTDWFAVVTAEPGGGDRLSEICIRDDIITSGPGMWTTSSDAKLESSQFPDGFEPTIFGGTVTVNNIVYRRCLCSPAVYNNKDYAVFGAGATGNEEARRQQLAFVAFIGGAYTPVGNRRTVPTANTLIPSTEAGSFNRLIPRSQEWAEDGEPGGTCMQFPRAYDSQGDFIAMGYDVTWPSISLDFGDNIESDDCLGLYCNQTFSACLVDLPYIHVQTGPLFLEGSNKSYEEAGGTYRKNTITNQWVRTKKLEQVIGSNVNQTRRNMRYICKVENSGSGPDTRTLYQIHAPAVDTSSFTTIQILRSTQGGAPDSWSNFGASMTVAAQGMPLEIWATSTHLILNTLTKVRCRLVSTDSWVDGTNLPTGEKIHLEVHGNKCYVMVRGKGLYVATINSGSASLSFSLLKNFNGITFGISPADTNRIVMFGIDRNVTPIGTHNGGSTWFNISSLPYAGQPEDFEHRLNGSPVWAMFHDTNPNLVFAMRYQHTGKSTDGGKTFVWASRGLDYSEIRWIGFHPVDPLRFFMCMTDKLTLVMDGGIALDDKLDGPAKEIIKGYIQQSISAFTAGGSLTLVRGNHTAYISSVGKNIGVKTPVISNIGTVITESDKTSTGNGALTVSITPNLPAGKYKATCITAASNGGTFKLIGPINIDMGNITVGVQTTKNHPRGGSITIKIDDGSIDFKAGAQPKVFTILVHPIKTNTILNPSTKGNGYYGGTNPNVPHRGITGRSVFELATDGTSSIIRTIPYEFMGYMGTDGTVVASSGNSTLMRGNDTGGAFTTWATNTGNFNPAGRQVVIGSRHNNQRAWLGTNNGMVKKVQNGTVTTVFSFDSFCTQHGISGGWPGGASVNGRMVPYCSGVMESAFDPNLLYACFYAVGMPMNFFRTKNALAATPIWENISAEGLVGWGPIGSDVKGKGLLGPIQAGTIHPLTDEVFLFSTHGTVMFKPHPEHIVEYSLPSVIDYIRSLPG
ncbi:MAG TPA: hypothetical protein PLY79_10865, partial [Ferruginibacter sp.]|nr:hypothetical protein [Ferruginibacter sp.]